MPSVVRFLLIAVLLSPAPASAQIIIDGTTDANQAGSADVVVDMSVLGGSQSTSAPRPAAPARQWLPPIDLSILPYPPRRPARPTGIAATPPPQSVDSPATPAPNPTPNPTDQITDLRPALQLMPEPAPEIPAAPEARSAAPARPDLPTPEDVQPPPAPTETVVETLPPPEISDERPFTPAPETEMPETPRTERPTEIPASADGARVETLADGAFRVIYEAGSDGIPDTGGAVIDVLAQQMSDMPEMRLQLLSFASASDGRDSAARQLSLRRALEVRTLFIDAGVRGTRIEVRALGANAQDGPADRIDLVPR